MKKSILELKGAKVLSKEEQKLVLGAGGCCNSMSSFGLAFPGVCGMFPPCHEN